MTLAIAEAQAQVSPDGRRSVSVFDAIGSRQHSTQKMQSAVRVPFVFLCFLVAGIAGQDVQPEMPVDFEPLTTTQEAITEAPLTTSSTSTTEVPTTIPTTTIPPETTTVPPPETTIIPPTETPTIPPTEQPIEITTTELTTTSATEPTTILITTTELTTTSTTEPTTILITTTESTTTTTTEPTTIQVTTTEPTTILITTTELTTTSTTEATTSSSPMTTQNEPIYPTYQPPSLPPYVRPTTSRRPIYTTKNPWNWNEPAERCYLKEQHQYITPCWGFGWKSSFTCYRCCYYGHSNFAGCSKLHQGRCWWFD